MGYIVKDNRQHIRKQAWALWKAHRSKCLPFCDKQGLSKLDIFLGKESFNCDGEIIEYSVCIDYKWQHWTKDGIDAKESEKVYIEIKSKKVTRKNNNLRLDFHITFSAKTHIQKLNLIKKLMDPKIKYWLLIRVTHLGETIIDLKVLIRDTDIIKGLKKGKTDFTLHEMVKGKSFSIERFDKEAFQKFSTPKDRELLARAIKNFERRKK